MKEYQRFLFPSRFNLGKMDKDRSKGIYGKVVQNPFHSNVHSKPILASIVILDFFGLLLLSTFCFPFPFWVSKREKSNKSIRKQFSPFLFVFSQLHLIMLFAALASIFLHQMPISSTPH